MQHLLWQTCLFRTCARKDICTLCLHQTSAWNKIALGLLCRRRTAVGPCGSRPPAVLRCAGSHACTHCPSLSRVRTNTPGYDPGYEVPEKQVGFVSVRAKRHPRNTWLARVGGGGSSQGGLARRRRWHVHDSTTPSRMTAASAFLSEKVKYCNRVWCEILVDSDETTESRNLLGVNATPARKCGDRPQARQAVLNLSHDIWWGTDINKMLHIHQSLPFGYGHSWIPRFAARKLQQKASSDDSPQKEWSPSWWGSVYSWRWWCSPCFRSGRVSPHLVLSEDMNIQEPTMHKTKSIQFRIECRTPASTLEERLQARITPWNVPVTDAKRWGGGGWRVKTQDQRQLLLSNASDWQMTQWTSNGESYVELAGRVRLQCRSVESGLAPRYILPCRWNVLYIWRKLACVRVCVCVEKSWAIEIETVYMNKLERLLFGKVETENTCSTRPIP